MVIINDSMQNAMEFIKEHDIHMLPVLKKEKLVGIVTDRDRKRACASDATLPETHEILYTISKIKVSEIMTKSPITFPLDYIVENRAEIFLKNKISGP